MKADTSIDTNILVGYTCMVSNHEETENSFEDSVKVAQHMLNMSSSTVVPL
jgi:hypothetical protein